jgi:hypothetical protein
MNRIGEGSKEYDLCGQVIGAAMKVHSSLGPGFLVSVYQNPLIWELRKAGLNAEVGLAITVQYDEVQLVNYLVATGIDKSLLLNFGAERLEYKKSFGSRGKSRSLSDLPDSFC